MKVTLGANDDFLLPEIPVDDLAESALKKHGKRVRVQRYCIHSRGLRGPLDFPERELEFKNLMTHIEHCVDCQDKIGELNRLEKVLDENISLYRPSFDQENSFQSEFDELFSHLVKISPSKEKKILIYMGNICKDLFATCIRPHILLLFGLTFLWVYLFLILSW